MSSCRVRYGYLRMIGIIYVVIGNAIVWLFSMFAPEILEYIYFSPYLILRGQVWRLVTFIIYPVNTGYLAIITFYFYYMIGRTLEQQWGSGKFTIYFFSGVFLTVLYCFAAYLFISLRIPADLTLPRDLALLSKLPLAINTNALAGMAVSGAEAAELRSILLQAANIPATATYIYFSMFFAFAALYPEMNITTGQFWIVLWGISIWFVLQRLLTVKILQANYRLTVSIVAIYNHTPHLNSFSISAL